MPRRVPIAVGLLAAAVIAIGLQLAGAQVADPPTTTPIKHVVVIFGENISFDHYFGTYPNAANLAGETPFVAKPGTPAVDGLTPALLTANPNGVNPTRLGPNPASGTVTCGNNHGYSAEQRAFNGGAMDKFPPSVGCGAGGATTMSYFDGNTVTAYWNYAQTFAMSDRHFGTGFGPSTLGALELVSGDLTGPVDKNNSPIATNGGSINNNTVYSNGDPFLEYDRCGSAGSYMMSIDTGGAGQRLNVGDLLNAKGVSWGWFQGGFAATSRDGAGHPACDSAHPNVAGANQRDYDAHHNPFSYYKSTANPDHLAPAGAIGSTDQANHNYDLTDFHAAVAAGKLPAVSFLKAGHYQDGHAGYSSPIDEQHFIVDEVNRIAASDQWSSTAVILAYDDSDGWYDHYSPPIVRTSQTAEDFYSGAGSCGLGGAPGTADAPDRCGYGPRLPLVVISPYAKSNFVDHSVTDQTSILRFIEDNWSLGRIGHNSVDKDAGSIAGMFDFSAGGARSPAVQLNQDGTVRCIGAACGAVPTPTATSTPTATPTSTPTFETKPELGRLACSGKRKAKRATLTCKVQERPGVPTFLRLRLKRRGKQVAAKSAELKGKSVTVVLKAKRRLRAGKYKLAVTITQVDHSGELHRTLTLKL